VNKVCKVDKQENENTF